MYAMFIKEMQQFSRSLAMKLAILLSAGAWILVFFIFQADIPDAKTLAVIAEKDPTRLGEAFRVFWYIIGIMLMNVAALISVLGSSAGRWKLELSDPAFSPGITTCTPAWNLALGKLGALLAQLISVLLAGGIIPLFIAVKFSEIRLLSGNFDRRFNAEELLLLAGKLPLAAICMTAVWAAMTLAVCSRKSSSRSKVDIGMIVAMLWLAPQATSLLWGTSMDNWVVNMLIRGSVLIVGAYTLIVAGVSAPGANRLFFFKLWMALSGLVIMPLLWLWQGIYSAESWSEILIVLSVLFLLCSLFERLIQSRRVLAQLDNPVLAAVAFPFSTGALNSVVLAAVIAVAAHLADKMESGSIALLLFFAAAISLCNMAGFFFERRGVKFKRFIAFILLTAFIWVLMAVGAVYECKYLLKHELGNAAVIFAILTVVFNLPLIINYNCRKKGL